MTEADDAIREIAADLRGGTTPAAALAELGEMAPENVVPARKYQRLDHRVEALRAGAECARTMRTSESQCSARRNPRRYASGYLYPEVGGSVGVDVRG